MQGERKAKGANGKKIPTTSIEHLVWSPSLLRLTSSFADRTAPSVGEAALAADFTGIGRRGVYGFAQGGSRLPADGALAPRPLLPTVSLPSQFQQHRSHVGHSLPRCPHRHRSALLGFRTRQQWSTIHRLGPRWFLRSCSFRPKHLTSTSPPLMA